ncbi:MAG: glycoside hydrolase family 32 protein [Clostridia bacterium]|nr:glycoside hydrolase family 32 protein [Clostridia bacterium]
MVVGRISVNIKIKITMLFFNKKYIFLLVCLVVSVTFLKAQMPTDGYRPVFHFTPAQNWINDPNGLVYYDGEYHLFYQYNPSGSQWGNMSWGHAVSSDLFGWQELPVALPVVNEVMAFSGSAVMDWNNSSGFGDGSLPPLVVVYTAASQGNQRQHVAYSTDRGRTWQQYAGNPVLNLFDDNFRDPKVIWFAPSQQWIMVVALPDKHRVRFYSSDNLKEWNFLSDFGNAGDQSGAWECPDLFPLPVNGNPANIKWVLQVDVTPGKSQYFIGHFNGQQFLADDYPEETIDDLPYGDVIGSFDGNTYGGWSISGTAFGTAPAQGALPNQLPVAGFLGTGLANSYNGGDQSIGTLTSPVFNITQRYLNFKFGGGRSDKATIALFINNEKIYSRTGNKDEYLYWESWNVNDYQGQQAQVVITDSATGGWGHILADHFFMSAVAMTQGEPPVGNIIADFEQATYTGWQLSGSAFGSAPATGALPGQQAITGFLGGQLVNSYMGGDAATGKMISTDFVIDSSYIAFLIGGGHHPDKAFIRLIADGVVVGEATGDDSETLQWKYWDVQTLTGTEAHIEIIDSATAGWGHINVDHIIQTNQLPQNPPVCRVDYGMDFYAAQSYADIPANDGRRLWLAWMSNWSYAGITPTAPWRGAMTVPRQVRLADDDGTIILMQQPVKELQLLRDSVIRFDNQFLNEIKHALDSLRMQVFELDVTMVVDQSNETGFEIRTSNTQHTLVKYDA